MPRTKDIEPNTYAFLYTLVGTLISDTEKRAGLWKPLPHLCQTVTRFPSVKTACMRVVILP